jgi:phosphoribosylamine--glycine ligase
MKVLVIGKGGREHALVWKLAQSGRTTRVYCAPGNAGTALDGENVALDPNDFGSLIRFAKTEAIGLTVVGPEEPLARGIVDAFQAEGLRVFGPSKAAAQLESSKLFAKKMMRVANVPTAEFQVFDHSKLAYQYLESREYVALDGMTLHGPYPPENLVSEGGKHFVIVHKGIEGPRRFLTFRRPQPRKEPLNITTVKVPVGPPHTCVVKADGLAAGKGVFVCDNGAEAMAAVERIMVKEEFARPGERPIVIIEKRLQGEELSVLALVSGRTIVTLPACQDHKRAGDGDTGPNTGGMGAYCPAPLGTAELLAEVGSKVLVPTVHTMKRRRQAFRGVLYAGLMVTDRGPKVLEFNARFGDPECQPLLMRLKTDLLTVLEAVVDEKLEEIGPLEWDERPSVCVVMASKGYPGPYDKGYPITGLDAAAKLPDVKVFHAGTKKDGERVLTDGGRVLGVTALGDTLAEAQRRAYEAVEKIHFGGAFYRRDIGNRAIES